MGQRAVHATITQDERTGLITVNHVTVQWSTYITENLQFALQHAGKDGYTQDELLKLIKKTIADMEHIGAFNMVDEDYEYYDRHSPMEGYCFVARNHEDGKEYRLGVDKGDGLLLSKCKESERFSTPRAFAKRKAAEKFIKEHGHAQDGVSYLWDLDTNQFTFFTNSGGALEAYDFATGETVICKEITYSLDQLRHPNASATYDSRMSSKRIVRLYEGALPAEPSTEEESESDIALRASQRLPLQWPGGDVPTHARIALLKRSPPTSSPTSPATRKTGAASGSSPRSAPRPGAWTWPAPTRSLATWKRTPSTSYSTRPSKVELTSQTHTTGAHPSGWQTSCVT